MRLYDQYGMVKVTATVSVANPTASVGLTAVNGSATTAMRSDAAPALDQSIAPTWTAAHKFALTSAAAFVSGPAATGFSNVQFHVNASGGTLRGMAVQSYTSANATALFWNADTSGDNNIMQFATDAGGTTRGSITYNRGAGTISYNTTSDARLKQNVTDAVSAGSTIDALRVRSFEWKSPLEQARAFDPTLTRTQVEESIKRHIRTRNKLPEDAPVQLSNDITKSEARMSHWFVAQELHSAYPSAVKVGGASEAWAVDVSALVPLLVKEVQELRARVAALEAKTATRT